MAFAGGDDLVSVAAPAAALLHTDDRIFDRVDSIEVHNHAPAPVANADLVILFLRMFDEGVSDRFLVVLKEAEARQMGSTGTFNVSKMVNFFKSSLAHRHSSKESKEAWRMIKAECYEQFQKKDSVKGAHPLASFVFWLTTHCCIDHICKGMQYMKDFVEGLPQSDEVMANVLRILHEFRFAHFPERDFSKQKYQTQCIFDGEQHHYLFSLCDCESEHSRSDTTERTKERNALHDFVQSVTTSSDVTARWLRRETGRSFKLWGRMSKREYDRCEVVKCSADSKGDKWRHMIYAYAIMALLWSEYNGNKEGPLGDYPGRRGSELGRMIDREEYRKVLRQLEADDQCVPQDLLKTLLAAEFVFPSKAGSGPADYNGHNIVALAVGKRGEILRISFNHNTLFSSTVDHAEERLIDGLYKDPEAFVQMSHARLYDSKLGRQEKMEVEKHMRHISVYTSLEPCQQCSGKFHLALVPEVIFCQRDWEIELLQGQLYERHHKCRPIPASYFGFTPYEELAIAYNHFCQKIRASKDGVVFFRQQAFSKGDKAPLPVLAKQTMPYFLCSNEAQLIFRRGSIIFTKLLHILFQGPKSACHEDDDVFNWSAIRLDSDFQKSEVQDCIMERFNFDMSDWTSNSLPSAPEPSLSSDSHSSSQSNASPRPRTWCARVSSGSPIAKPAAIKSSNALSEIRQFRPSLNAKQNRLSQDELISLRGVWIDNLFKQRRTLMFEFDRYSGITEKDIDTNISPLGEIEGIYLGRSLDGTLKGTFDVTFASFDVARVLKLMLKNIEKTHKRVRKPDDKICLEEKEETKTVIEERHRATMDPRTRQKVVNAAEWLLCIRKPGPKEFFVTKNSESFFQDPELSSFVEYIERDPRMKRQFPRQRDKTPIVVVSCKNVAGKRRLQQLMSGCPSIRLLAAGRENSVPVMLRGGRGLLVSVKTWTGKTIALECESSDTIMLIKSIITSKLEQEECITSDHHLFFADVELEDQHDLAHYAIRNNSVLHLADFVRVTPPQPLSVIARIDVSEEELLAMIQRCYMRPDHMKLKELPSFFAPELNKLSTCNSGKTLQWLDIREAQTPKLKDWNLWGVQFRATAEFNLGLLQSPSGQDEQSRFCQPFPQSIFDFALSGDEHRAGTSFVRWDPAKFPAAADRSSGDGFVLRIVFARDTVSNINGKRGSLLTTAAAALVLSTADSPQVRSSSRENSATTELHEVLDLQFVGAGFTRVKARSAGTKEPGCVIKMDENSVATLLFCGMLDDARIEHLCDHWTVLVREALQKRAVIQQAKEAKVTQVNVKQPDFWGREMTLLLNIFKSPSQGIEANFLEREFQFSAKNFICGLRSIARAFMLEHSAPVAALQDLSLSHGHSQIFCRFCGLRSVINNSILACFGPSISACCIGHFQSDSVEKNTKSPDDISPKFKLNVMQKIDTPSYEDPVKQKGAGNALAKIKRLENELFLSLNVKSLTAHEPIDGVHCLIRLHLRLYRDEFDGPAFIAFCIDSSEAGPSVVERVRVEICAANFSVDGIISKTAEPASSVAITGSTAEQPEQHFKFIEKLARVHGKLSIQKPKQEPVQFKEPAKELPSDPQRESTYPEGGTIPADDLRYFFEPEYFLQLLESKPTPSIVHEPAYPAIDMCVYTKGGALTIPVHSWYFEEFQTKKLEELIATRRKLIEATFLKEKRGQELQASVPPPPDDARAQWTLRLEPIAEQPILFATLSSTAESDSDLRHFRIPVQFSETSPVVREGSFVKESLDHLMDCAARYSEAANLDKQKKKAKEKPAFKKGDVDDELDAHLSAYFDAIKRFIALTSESLGKKKAESLKKSACSVEDLFLNHRDSLCSNFPDLYLAPLVALLARALKSNNFLGDVQRQRAFCSMMSKLFNPEKKLYEALEEFQTEFFHFFSFSCQLSSAAGEHGKDERADASQACAVAAAGAKGGDEGRGAVRTGGGGGGRGSAAGGRGGAAGGRGGVAAFKYSQLWNDFAENNAQERSKEEVKAELPLFAAQLIRSIMLSSGGVACLQVIFPAKEESKEDAGKVCETLCRALQGVGAQCSVITAETWGNRLKHIRLQQDVSNSVREIANLKERWVVQVLECLHGFEPAGEIEKVKKGSDAAADDARETDVNTLETFKFFLQEGLFEDNLIELVRAQPFSRLCQLRALFPDVR
jgi:tRNA(Arg) A34 adenosine deaminase TadA